MPNRIQLRVRVTMKKERDVGLPKRVLKLQATQGTNSYFLVYHTALKYSFWHACKQQVSLAFSVMSKINDERIKFKLFFCGTMRRDSVPRRVRQNRNHIATSHVIECKTLGNLCIGAYHLRRLFLNVEEAIRR